MNEGFDERVNFLYGRWDTVIVRSSFYTTILKKLQVNIPVVENFLSGKKLAGTIPMWKRGVWQLFCTLIGYLITKIHTYETNNGH